MSNFVQLTHAEYASGSTPGQGTYRAGTPVYVKPEVVIAILPHRDFTWLVLSEDQKQRTGIGVMETSEEVHAALQKRN